MKYIKTFENVQDDEYNIGQLLDCLLYIFDKYSIFIIKDYDNDSDNDFGYFLSQRKITIANIPNNVYDNLLNDIDKELLIIKKRLRFEYIFRKGSNGVYTKWISFTIL